MLKGIAESDKRINQVKKETPSLDEKSHLEKKQILEVAYRVQEVNPNAYYDETLILKVWDTYITKKKSLKYFSISNIKEDIEVTDSLFSGGDAMLLSKNAGILITRKGDLYKRKESAQVQEKSISVCSLVNYRSSSLGGYDAISSNLEIAFNQIASWNQKHEGMVDQQIRSHLILFPYHKTDAHWNLGVLALSFENGVLEYISIKVYEPYGGGQISEDVRKEIQKLKSKIFKEKKAIIEVESIKNDKHIKQQNDGVACGPISSENAKDFIDGTFERLKITYPRGAKDLRLQHLQEVQNNVFCQRQWEDRRYTDNSVKGDEEILSKNEVTEKLLKFINLLDIIGQQLFKESFQALRETCGATRGCFVRKLNFLREKELSEGLNETEQLEVAKFSANGTYIKHELALLSIDPSMCAIRKVKFFFMQYKKNLKEIALGGTNLFDVFFNESLEFQNGARSLLEKISEKQSDLLAFSDRELKLLQDTPRKIQALSGKMVIFFSYPGFVAASSFVEVREQDETVILESSEKNNLEWIKERILQELTDHENGLGKYLSASSLEDPLTKLLGTPVHPDKDAGKVVFSYSLSLRELDVIISAIDRYYSEFSVVLHPENYENNKRPNFMPGFSGGLYQGEVAIYYMLDGIQKKKHFDIRAETTDLDKWDDFKIIYANRKKGIITEVIYVQTKHGYKEDSFLLPGNFYNKSGEAELTINGEKLVGNTKVFTLPMYFDDWLEFRKNPQYKHIKDKASFILFSNRTLCEKVPGFLDCFTSSPRKLTKDFIEGVGIYKKKPKEPSEKEKCQFNFRKNLFKRLVEDSEFFKKKSYTDQKKSNLVKAFLKNIIFKVGEEHLKKMERTNKNTIRLMYPHLNADAIYYAFRFKIHEWLLMKKGVISFTDDTVQELLQESASRYLYLGELIGVTRTNLDLEQIKLGINGKFIEREDEFEKLKKFIGTPNEKALIIYGESGIGKTTFLKHFLINYYNKIKNYEWGNYLFFEGKQLKLSNIEELQAEGIKIIIIDKIEHFLNVQNLKSFQQIIEALKKTRKKLILFCQTAQKENLINNFIRDVSYKTLLIKRLSLAKITENFPELYRYQKMSPLMSLAQIPFYLSAIVELTGTQGFDYVIKSRDVGLEAELMKLVMEGQAASTMATRRLICQQLAVKIAQSKNKLDEGASLPASVNLSLLVEAGIIELQPNEKYRFTHDLFFEHALMSFLLQKWETAFVEGEVLLFWQKFPPFVMPYGSTATLKKWFKLHYMQLSNELFLLEDQGYLGSSLTLECPQRLLLFPYLVTFKPKEVLEALKTIFVANSNLIRKKKENLNPVFHTIEKLSFRKEFFVDAVHLLIKLIAIIQSDLFMQNESFSYFSFSCENNEDDENRDSPLVLLKKVFKINSEYAESFFEERLNIIREIINEAQGKHFFSREVQKIQRRQDLISFIYDDIDDDEFIKKTLPSKKLQLVRHILRCNVEPDSYKYPKFINRENFFKRRVLDYYLQSVRMLKSLNFDQWKNKYLTNQISAYHESGGLDAQFSFDETLASEIGQDAINFGGGKKITVSEVRKTVSKILDIFKWTSDNMSHFIHAINSYKWDVPTINELINYLLPIKDVGPEILLSIFYAKKGQKSFEIVTDLRMAEILLAFDIDQLNGAPEEYRRPWTCEVQHCH